MTPSLTVLMPAFNSALTIETAIESILGQTYSDFEFLIFDDGSLDDTAARIKSYAEKDRRIRLIENGINLGLIRTLNRGLDEARGQFIARMDADDISRPRRFEMQMNFLRDHPDVAVCGTALREFGGSRNRTTRPPLGHETIIAHMVFDCPIAHPSVVIRNSVLKKHNLRYNAAHKHAEDLGLWLAISRFAKLANLPDVLLDYRVSQHSITGVLRRDSHAFAERQRAERILCSDVFERLGLQVTPSQLDLHLASLWPATAATISLEQLDAWYEILLNAARGTTGVDVRGFAQELAHRRILSYRWNKSTGLKKYRQFRTSAIGNRLPLQFTAELKFLLRSIFG
ncbi:MAG: glycosyltransferase family 2 protein [Leptospirales bacterium]|nr:glycosyltransferase family 2 protein [Leptospirales bacterium]